MAGSCSLRQPSWHERYRQCLRISLTFLFSQVGLTALVVAYSAAGAVLFEWLEADQEIEPRRRILQTRLDCLNRLVETTTTNYNQFYTFNASQWSTDAIAILKEFESHVVKATKEEGYDGKEVDDAERQWSVSGALLYSITVITTIGYGNLAPKTAPGKLATMLYALIGIPLMLLCLSNLGSFMASSFQFAFGKIYCCFWCSSQQCCCKRRRRRPFKLPAEVQIQTPPFVNIQPTNREDSPASIRMDTKTPEIAVQDDLAALTERDYDVVIQPEGQLMKSHNPDRFYGFDRLDQDARSVLADCSQYGDVQADELTDSADKPGRVPIRLNDENNIKAFQSTSSPPVINQSAIVITGQNNNNVYQQQQQQRVPVSVVLAFLVGYIGLGSVVFSSWEEWSYLDGAYFSFITLSTIGFGDLVPGSKVLEQGQAKLVACIIYLVVGLAMIAMSFNLVQEEVINHFQKLGQNMGILDEK